MTREELMAKIEECSTRVHLLRVEMEQTTDASERLSILMKMTEIREEAHRLRGMWIAQIMADYEKEVSDLTKQLTRDLILERTEGF